VRKDEFDKLLVQDKDLVKKFKEANCGDTNDQIAKQVEDLKKDIEALNLSLAPFKKSKAKMIT
jgi:hypothetical protein